MSWVWPPETSKATNGKDGGSALKNGDSKWPSKWWMPMTGLPKLAASAQAVNPGGADEFAESMRKQAEQIAKIAKTIGMVPK